MAVAPAETHFVQCCEGPVFIGSGTGTLNCECGHTLIQNYDPARFLAVGIQCGRCATVAVTPKLPDGQSPPFAVVIAEPTAEQRVATTTLPRSAFIIGRREMDRIISLYQPVTPPENTYRMTPAALDAVEAAHEQLVGVRLPTIAADLADPFAGLTLHALGWAMGHLRARMQAASWNCIDSAATAAASCQVAGFRHFVATWSHHPLFPAIVATAADGGFSCHALAPFAAAHCLTMQANRISFPPVTGYPGRIEAFNLATGPTETVSVQFEIFDQFEFPFGQPWDETGLRAAVADRVGAAQGRINLRNPGLLLLSPGIAMPGYDEALIHAVQAAMPAIGRKNRGLMAVAPIVLRLLPTAAADTVRFGYGFFPVANRHYRGETLLEPGR